MSGDKDVGCEGYLGRGVVGGILVVVGAYFFFQAEDGIRDAQESRGLGDVYKRQVVKPTRDARRHVGVTAMTDNPVPVDLPPERTFDLSLIHI